jgi:hypothetical protein
MSNEKTLNAGQVEILIHPGRQSPSPFQLIFTPLPDKESDDREQQFDFILDDYVIRGE